MEQGQLDPGSLGRIRDAMAADDVDSPACQLQQLNLVVGRFIE